MAVTSIEWTATPRPDGTMAPGYTFNPWRGCTKVSPGCQHCYAETMSHRNPAVLGEWGPGGKRVIAVESYWRQPLKWDREAAAARERRRVFCASLADVFEDRPELQEPRVRLFDLILATPHLDWLLLTKRPNVMRDWLTGPGMFGDRIPHEWGDGWPNVWLGASVEDQARMRDRGEHLLATPASVHFLSMEPLLAPVDASNYLHRYHGRNPTKKWPHGRVDWVIIGGESGPGARPMDLAWARSLVAQCKSAGVPVFVKQLGARPLGDYYCDDPDEREQMLEMVGGIMVPTRGGWSEHGPHDGQPPPGARMELKLRDRKGGAVEEWPEDLRVREFPEVAR